MVGVEFGILGPLVVQSGGGEVRIGAAKPRALLVRLLVDANRAIPAERLVEDLWEGDPPRSAAQTLQTYVSQLRKLLGSDRVVTEPGGYRISIEPDELDARRFEAEVDEGRGLLARNPGGAIERLETALARWRGTPLADAAGASWAVPESSRLDELRMVATETRLEAQLALGDRGSAIAGAEAAVAEHPLRERLWALLMTALYQEGRQADALRAFQRLRRELGEQLGIEPSTELQALEQRMLQQDVELAGPPPSRTASLPTGVVTFVLSDIAGSTRLWETAAPAMADAVAHHEELLRAAVERHGGVFLKGRGEGDSTFSVFQRATDAIAATVVAQAALRGTEWPTPAPLEVRIAVHTGEAIEREGDYYGRAVNRAARLRAATLPGRILVSQATAELVMDDLPHGYRLQTMGVQQLRDIDRPETVYVVTSVDEPLALAEAEPQRSGPAVVPLPARLAHAPGMGFVGRQSEREALHDALKAATQGTGRVVLLAGEPGIGKTTLAAHVARAAHAAGATVLFGRCDEDAVVPHRPWVEGLGHLVAHVDHQVLAQLPARQLADLARLLPGIGDRLPDVTPSTGGDADTDRWSVYTAVGALLSSAAAAQPVVLVLDDLHWADRPTLLLLRHIVDAIEGSAVLVVGTYRDSELTADHPFVDVLASLRRAPTTDRLALRGLADEEVVSLVEAATGQALLPDALDVVHAVYRESDGNPFFVEALLRHLAETGAVYVDDAGRWVPRADLDEAGLPDSVREVVGRRVARLGDRCQRLLTLAAVIGQEFDLETITAAAREPEDDVFEALETATAAGLVTALGPGRFGFAHALVATTLYASLTPTRRARLHRDLAEAIEVLDPQRRAGELARHWAAATAPADRIKAVEYARHAGDNAMAGLAPDDASRWYRQALELLDEQPAVEPRAQADLLVRLGRAQRNAADPAHRTTLLDAARMARDAGDGPLLARAALANTRGFVGYVDDQIEARREMLEAALAATDDADSVIRARLLATLAAELVVTRDFDRCRDLSDEALAMARRLDDPALLASVLNLVVFAKWHPHTLAERLGLTAEAVALAGNLDNRALLHWAANWRMHAVIESGDVDEGARVLDVMTTIAAETGQPSLQWTNRAYRAALALLHGDTAMAEQLGAEAVAVAHADNALEVHEIYSGQLALIAWHHGRLDDDMPRLRDAAARVKSRGSIGGGSVSVLVSSWVGADPDISGDGSLLESFDKVEDSVVSTRRWSDRVIGDVGWVGRAALWTEFGSASAPEPEVRYFYEALVPYHDQVASAGSLWLGAVAGILAKLARRLGLIDDAERHFAEAEQVNSRIRAPFFLARDRVDWARLLLERGRPGDADRAADLLTAALEVAHQYGCAEVVRDAEALLAAPPPLPARLASAVRANFVGRAPERAALAEAIGHGGGLALVAGEPGIGKSTLVAQAALVARDGGAWVVHGRCDEDLRVPFLPFVEAVNQLVAAVPDATLERVGDRHLAELVRIAPALADRRPGLPSPQATDPDTERYLFMNAVVASLVEASRLAPLVFVIDDLHWADKPSVLLLRHVLAGISGSAVSVLGTYRHTDLLADTPLAEVLADLRRDPAVRIVTLDGLTVEEVTELTGTDSEVATRLHRETDGNPFFAVELSRHLQETDADLSTLPHAVRGVVAKRVGRAGDDVRSVLSAASAIGQEFDLELLARVLEQSALALLDVLERAERAGLVQTVVAERFAFAHALVQRTLYDEVQVTRRARLHREIAVAIDDLGWGDQRVTELARHWAEAAVTPEDVKQAIAHAALAADQALGSLAPNEAARWYSQALELLSRQAATDEPLRCRLLIGLTEAQVRAGDPTFRQTRVQAAELALRLDDTDALVEAVLKDYQLASYGVGHDPDMAGLRVEALRRVGDADSPARALLLSRIGQDFLFSDPEEHTRLKNEAEAVARRLGDLRTLAEVLAIRGWDSPSYERRLAKSTESLSVAEEVGDPNFIFSAAHYLSWLYVQSTRLEAADALVDRMRAIAAEVQRPDFRWSVLLLEASHQLLHGDIAAAERLAEAAYELGRGIESPGRDVLHAALVESIRWQQGRPGAARDLVATAAEAEPDLAILRIPVTMAGSDGAESLTTAIEAMPRDSAWLVGAPVMADIAARTGDAEAAALLYDELLPIADLFAWIGTLCRGPVAHSLAVLARTMGDHQKAEEHFRAADEINERMRAPFFAARTWLEWGSMLLADGAHDDRARAIAMLERALETAEQRGYAQIARRARRTLDANVEGFRSS